MTDSTARSETWPVIVFDEWKDTQATLHLWTQIVGKVRLATSPWINHSWSVTLYVTPRGLTTRAMPFQERTFQIDFDFIAHELLIQSSDGEARTISLRPMPVADFYRAVFSALRELGIDVEIHGKPNEVETLIPFAEDHEHASYDADYVNRFWRALVSIDRVFDEFRAGFIGKCSPVHFFWGSFDLAVTRFSGRTAPEHPGGIPNLPDRITREAYSHEVSSVGFWPGSPAAPPVFYSYAYPAPEGFSEAKVRPDGAGWFADLSEFVLPYDTVRESDSPDAALLEFCQSTYKAAADLAKWDRPSLERTFRP